MEPGQNFANDISSIDVSTIRKQAYVLSPQQQTWIDYKAMGGTILDKEQDKFVKLSMQELSEMLGVSRQTLYNWRDEIPGFWNRVAERRIVLNSGEWLARLHDEWKIHARSFKDWRITEAWLINFDPTYKAPKLKVEHELGDKLIDALSLARTRQRELQNIQEGEVVEPPND